jgi:hypothetical protein
MLQVRTGNAAIQQRYSTGLGSAVAQWRSAAAAKIRDESSGVLYTGVSAR